MGKPSYRGRMMILSYAIWFIRDQRARPLPGAPLSMKYGRQSTEGGARGGRLSVDGTCNQEPDGDTRRRDSDLDRFGPLDRRNTLHPVSLVYCIELYVDDPCLSLYTLEG